jgi:hypothetical protein
MAISSLLLPALIFAAFVGVLAILLILHRQQRAAAGPSDHTLAASSEGMKLCPSCHGANLWTQDRCIHCGNRMSDAPHNAS